MASNAVPPSVTPPSPLEWPQNLVLPITAIAKGSLTTITSPNHGFTSQDEGQTFVGFKQVQGMLQINGLNALVQKVLDVNRFTVNVDSTNFYTYASAGVVLVDSGRPPVQQAGFQYFNTPFQNIA